MAAMRVGPRALELVKDRIVRLCGAGLDSRTLQREVMAALRRAMPCDAWCIGTIDPATLMITSSIGEGYPMKGSGRFLEIEYGEPGPHKYAELARRTPPVGTLVQAVGGDLETSVYWRDICRPAGLRDELRAALVVDETCWGSLALARSDALPDFGEEEIEYVAGLSALVATGVRASLIVDHPPLEDASFGPGLIVLADDLEPEAISPAGERWLEELRESESDWMGPLPNSVYSVVSRLRQLDSSEAVLLDLMPRIRVCLRTGQWLSVQASRLTAGDGRRQVAVIIEPTGPTELAPLIVRAYSLTSREREIASLVLQGLATKQIATTVHITPGTVQQHLKTIFDKIGVRSRRELVSRIFDQQYLPRLKSGQPVGPDGWFADQVDSASAG
jgi:DNA-binding CsgD family transcriptional regulator